MDNILLRPSEVCELIGMGKSKTYELIAAGVIPSVRIGKSRRVPAQELRQWVEGLRGGDEPQVEVVRRVDVLKKVEGTSIGRRNA